MMVDGGWFWCSGEESILETQIWRVIGKLVFNILSENDIDQRAYIE